MFLLLICAACFVLYLAFRWKAAKMWAANPANRSCAEGWAEFYSVARVISMLLFVCFLFATVIKVGTDISDQMNDIEKLTQLGNVQTIRETKANDLGEQFRDILLTKYPDHEMEIMKNFSPKNVSVYFVSYPELRAIEGARDLSAKLNELWRDFYEVQEQREVLLANMRYRTKTPWSLFFVIPAVPEVENVEK